MRNKFFTVILLILLSFMLPCTLVGQTWEFVKEKDGVQLFTRQETGKNLKLFKGVAEINEPADKVFALIEDVNHTEWWDAKISQIKVLLYEKNKLAQYYMIYKMPWPFKDRDMSVNVTASINSANGEFQLIATPLADVSPESKDLVRIKDFRQKWTIKPVNNRTHVELEFYVDAIDNIPGWIVNLALIETPINSIKSIRQLLKKNIPFTAK